MTTNHDGLPRSAAAAVDPLDDPRVLEAVEEYRTARQAGDRVDRQAFLARHADIAVALAACLDGLDVMRQLGSQMEPATGAVEGGAFSTGTPLGDFRIVREIGRGGMGVVYEAEQLSLGRRVALKVLPFAAALDGKQLQRFKNEAQAAAHLHHPHIVPVHAVGCERGVHYYAMQFIEGHTLAAVIRSLREGAAPADPARLEPHPSANTQALAALSTQRSTRGLAFFRTAAQLGEQAAEALEHAHQQGVVHRDIKPANLLLDGCGQLWITDFGLARFQTDAGLTQTGDLVGTLRYMSPEQALGQRGALDHRTDVYSLGATLYELLALQPAVPGRDRAEVLRQLEREEPRPLRQVQAAIPADLETVVHKALAKEPAERYQTARELADELQRFLDDKPIQARRPTLRQRARKWARRHRTVVRAAGVVLLLAVAALAVSTVLIWQAKEDLNQALERERQFHEQERRNSYCQRIALAEREWSANDLRRMHLLLEECPPDLRGWEWHYLQRLRLKGLPPLRHDSAVFCAAFSPDGARIASASQDGKVTLWDARSGQRLFHFEAHPSHARGVAFSPDGRRLATTSWDKTVKIWDLQRLAEDQLLAPHRTMVHQGVAWNVVFSPDGRRLASVGSRPARPDRSAGNFAEVKVWDPLFGQELCTLEGDEQAVWSALAFSPDGQFLATGHLESQDGVIGNLVHVWDASTGRKLRTFAGHTQPVHSVAFSPDGRCLASGAGKPEDYVGTDGELKVWEVQSGRELLDLRGHLRVYALAFSPDGQRLASGGADQTIKLWDTATGQEVVTLRGHLGMVRSLAFSPNGQQLVSASHDMTVRVWDATPLHGQSDSASLTLRGHHGDVAGVAFSPDGRYLASASLDKTVKVWERWTGKELRTLSGHLGAVLCVAFSPDGRCLASGGSRDAQVRIWDTTTWEAGRTFRQPGNWFHSLAFSPPDGKLLAVPGTTERGDRVVHVWDTATGQLSQRLEGHTWNIHCAAFDPAGAVLASAGTDGTVRLWDVRTGQELVRLQPEHAGGALSVAFSPDGKYLASGSLDRTVKIWNATTWQLLREIPDATGGITSVAFAPASQRLAWGSTDATVKVADVTTGKILETLRGHTGRVNGVAFSPDGQHIASASADGTVKLWPAPASAEPPRERSANKPRKNTPFDQEEPSHEPP